MNEYCDEWLSPDQKQSIIQLWNAEYPAAIQHQSVASFEAYLRKLSSQNHHIYYNEQNQVVAWFFTFVRDGELNFAMIVSREAQGQGLGASILRKAQETHSALNGWIVLGNEMQKADGSIYQSPRGFYEKLGFEIDESQIFETPQMKSVKFRWKRAESL